MTSKSQEVYRRLTAATGELCRAIVAVSDAPGTPEVRLDKTTFFELRAMLRLEATAMSGRLREELAGGSDFTFGGVRFVHVSTR